MSIDIGVAKPCFKIICYKTNRYFITSYKEKVAIP